ncbi:hypothetical protein D3C78_466800 [compost metagenome]|jgi:hypothetical protein
MTIKRKVTCLVFGVLLASGSLLEQMRLPPQTVAFESAATTTMEGAMLPAHFQSWLHFH